MPTLTKFAAPFFRTNLCKKKYLNRIMNHTKDFLRVVIHNRFKFAQKTLSYDKNINSRGAIPTRTEK